MATYLVGDIQGCYASLRALLRCAGFGGDDVLWCVGDLVNRGPDSLATLRFARDLGPRFACALGNHDLHFLAIVYGGHGERAGDTLAETLAAPDCAELADWLRRQPLLLETDAALVVHAGIPHVWDLATVRGAAREVEGVLRGPQHRAFFEKMYGDGPCWTATLAGVDRYRAIVNYLTRMRLVDSRGGLEFAHKGPPTAPPPGYRPWYDYPPQVDGRIYFGHWAALDGATGAGHAVGLDTGCVWGRRMTLARLPEGRLWSVAAAPEDRPSAGGWTKAAAGRRRLDEGGGIEADDEVKPSGVKTYLVGGAVRDGLLGRPVADRDFVVVGATAAAMRCRGFTQVGRDFPVFLHPRTGEHHALARTERKTGPGHAGFVCESAEVTLAEDLARRDLTINAMARAEDGTLVDLHGGQADLAAQRLRHVSDAFAEDPLRVFRVARFAAQLPGFRVADETLALMRRMVPELPSLAGERVWHELARAAAAPAPARFFEVLQPLDDGFWLAELDLPASAALFASRRFDDAEARLAGLGWTNTAATLRTVFGRLRAPTLLARAASAVARHGAVLAAPNPAPAALLDALAQIGAFRQGPLCALVLRSVEACAAASLAPLRQLIDGLRGERVRGASGPEYGRALRERRLRRVADAMPLRGA